MKRIIICVLLFISIRVSGQIDPLPSWNEGALKTSIINFVKDVSTEGGSKFVPVVDRIAVFDNDGTLWCEKPYPQLTFAFYQVKKMVEKNASLKNKQPYKAIMEKDTAYLHSMSERDIIGLVMATHTGMTSAEFESEVKAFFANATNGKGVPHSKLLYKPQVELLKFLRANGFTTYICTGGTIEFVRSISEEYYGIPPHQVIGTKFRYAYKDSASVNDLIRKPEIISFNDKQEKPVNILHHIGKRPIFACGNEGGGGDIYMLRFSQGSNYPNFQLMVNHDDKVREYYYQEKDNISLNWAKKYGWHVVSMKEDWKVIFVE